MSVSLIQYARKTEKVKFICQADFLFLVLCEVHKFVAARDGVAAVVLLLGGAALSCLALTLFRLYRFKVRV